MQHDQHLRILGISWQKWKSLCSRKINYSASRVVRVPVREWVWWHTTMARTTSKNGHGHAHADTIMWVMWVLRLIKTDAEGRRFRWVRSSGGAPAVSAKEFQLPGRLESCRRQSTQVGNFRSDFILVTTGGLRHGINEVLEIWRTVIFHLFNEGI